MMIINIPLQIDDVVLEGKIQQQYEKLIADTISNKIIDVFKNWDPSYSYQTRDANRGIEDMVKNLITKDITENYKDEIIEKAAVYLADKLSRTKKAKEMMAEKIGETK